MRYLYYRLWQLFSKVKTNDMPATNAMIFLSICQVINILTLYFILKHHSILNIDLFETKNGIYQIIIPFGLFLYVINYLFLYKKKEKLFNKYKNDSKKQIITGNIILLSYVAASFFLAIIA
jgi:hypothetical protein